MELTPLYRFKAKGTVEPLGRMPDGTRTKIEFRGATEPGSRVAGKVHGTDWILIGELGDGQVDSVHELTSPEGGRFILRLRGSATTEGGVTRLKACGVVRSGTAAFTHLDGHIAVAEGTRSGDDLDVAVYHF